jgi:hypothetical protein
MRLADLTQKVSNLSRFVEFGESSGVIEISDQSVPAARHQNLTGFARPDHRLPAELANPNEAPSISCGDGPALCNALIEASRVIWKFALSVPRVNALSPPPTMHA